MKRIILYFFLPIFLFCMSACNHKSSKQEKKETFTSDSVDSKGVQRMQESKSDQTVKLNGKSFHITLHRVSDDSLARVKTESGEWYVDNRITLRITGDKGNQIFSKTFTKKSFSSVVDEDFITHAILEGMVFDKVTSKGLIFAASVCYPQTDLYSPVTITITPTGSMSMAKEELMEEAYPEDKE